MTVPPRVTRSAKAPVGYGMALGGRDLSGITGPGAAMAGHCVRKAIAVVMPTRRKPVICSQSQGVG
jgi:hypothetical protein